MDQKIIYTNGLGDFKGYSLSDDSGNSYYYDWSGNLKAYSKKDIDGKIYFYSLDGGLTASITPPPETVEYTSPKDRQYVSNTLYAQKELSNACPSVTMTEEMAAQYCKYAISLLKKGNVAFDGYTSAKKKQYFTSDILQLIPKSKDYFVNGESYYLLQREYESEQNISNKVDEKEDTTLYIVTENGRLMKFEERGVFMRDGHYSSSHKWTEMTGGYLRFVPNINICLKEHGIPMSADLFCLNNCRTDLAVDLSKATPQKSNDKDNGKYSSTIVENKTAYRKYKEETAYFFLRILVLAIFPAACWFLGNETVFKQSLVLSAVTLIAFLIDRSNKVKISVFYLGILRKFYVLFACLFGVYIGMMHSNNWLTICMALVFCFECGYLEKVDELSSAGAVIAGLLAAAYMLLSVGSFDKGTFMVINILTNLHLLGILVYLWCILYPYMTINYSVRWLMTLPGILIGLISVLLMRTGIASWVILPVNATAGFLMHRPKNHPYGEAAIIASPVFFFGILSGIRTLLSYASIGGMREGHTWYQLLFFRLPDIYLYPGIAVGERISALVQLGSAELYAALIIILVTWLGAWSCSKLRRS